MSGCTETGKPRIAILMAVYEPRMDWLREQLLSLDAQSYPNLTLYIRDDCSPTVPFEEIQSCVQDCIHTFPYKIKRNEKNLGSNGTFELLTQEAEGEYFAYCDQDDVWLPEKLEVLEKAIAESGALLVCSDVYVIDGTGKKTANSITEVRHRHCFMSGKENVFHRLLTRNFVIGCTMLICRETAQAAIPFLPEMVHDHWLALFAASQGMIVSLPQPLIRYRIHGGNQTGVLVGVSSKQTYVDVRISDFQKRICHISDRLPDVPSLQAVRQWADARVAYAECFCWKNVIWLWHYRRENYATTIFELAALKLPEKLFCEALKLARIAG